MATTDDPEKVRRMFNRALSKRTARLALDITETLIELTPVDTGWARSNWVPSIGASFDALVGDHENVSTSEQQGGIDSIITRSSSIGAQPLYITNNVPYIEALNNGHSQQTPAGFVDFAVDLGVKKAYDRGDLR